MEKKELNKTTKSDIYRIDPRKIVVKENFNSRTDFGDIDELASQIKAQGVLNPITVIPFTDEEGNDKYRLVDGERRYKATMTLINGGYNVEKIPALFAAKSLTDEDLLVQQLMRNEGKPFTEYEYGVAFKKFQDMGLTNQQIADKLGIKRWKVDCFLAHLNRAPEVQKLMREGKITGVDVRHIYQAAKNEKSAVKQILKLADKAEKGGSGKVSLKDLDFDSDYSVAKDSMAVKKGLSTLFMYLDAYTKNGKIDIDLDIFDIYEQLKKEKKNLKQIFQDAVKKATA